MCLVGSDDGVYRVSDADSVTVTKTLDSGRVMRLRQFAVVDGVFAATKTGLYRSLDGTQWTELGVPETKVYAVSAGPAGALYAGTRPAHVYVTESIDTDTTSVEWHELDGFQELPSREEWRLPRHDDLSQVRDLHIDPAASNRIVAGVEVGGVHISENGGRCGPSDPTASTTTFTNSMSSLPRSTSPQPATDAIARVTPDGRGNG